MQMHKIFNNNKMVSSILYKIRKLEVENMKKCFPDHIIMKQSEWLNSNIKFCLWDRTLMFYLTFSHVWSRSFECKMEHKFIQIKIIFLIFQNHNCLIEQFCIRNVAWFHYHSKQKWCIEHWIMLRQCTFLNYLSRCCLIIQSLRFCSSLFHKY